MCVCAREIVLRPPLICARSLGSQHGTGRQPQTSGTSGASPMTIWPPVLLQAIYMVGIIISNVDEALLIQRSTACFKDCSDLQSGLSSVVK
eukprot:604879-Amphidinium_carterae.1